MNYEKQIKYFGDEYKPSKKVFLRSGPLSMYLKNGELWNIKYDDEEIIRRIYIAFRDKNWGTLNNKISNLNIDKNKESFKIDYDVQNQKGDIDFSWSAKIIGDNNGKIEFSMEGVANSKFYKNRIGFCILHPAECAGNKVIYKKVESQGGEKNKGEFPIDIQPHQPFQDLKSFKHQVKNNLWAKLEYEGDIFEMEDQRNWTDASYKTYCTPLSRPFPVLLNKGDKINQSVTLEIQGKLTVETKSNQASKKIFKLNDKTEKKLKEFGFCINDYILRDNFESKVNSIKKIFPSHLRLDLNFDEDEKWKDKIQRGFELSQQLNTPLWISLKISDAIPQLFGELVSNNCDIVDKIMISKNRPPWNTTNRMIKMMKNLISCKSDKISIGGGTDAFFTEINRSKPPTDVLDFICWSLNPQVHAFDNESLIETLPCQKKTADTAQNFSDGLPLIVSPVTFKMRFNPNATELESESPHHKITRDKIDSRQWGIFGALWTLLSLKYLSFSPVEQITYFDLLGPRGLIYYKESEIFQPGFDDNTEAKYYPVYHIFKEIQDKVGLYLYNIKTPKDKSLDGIALRNKNERILYLVNISSDTEEIFLKNFSDKKNNINVKIFSDKDWKEIVSNDDYKFSNYAFEKNNDMKLIMEPYTLVKISKKI